jgi:hypothetical protein
MMLDWIAGEHFPVPDRLFRWNDLQQQLIGGYRLRGYSGLQEGFPFVVGAVREPPRALPISEGWLSARRGWAIRESPLQTGGVPLQTALVLGRISELP